MSQNAQKLFNYLQENDPNPEVFGDFDFFNEQIKDPKNAEKLRQYLGNEETFGDSANFYNDLNAEDAMLEEEVSTDSNVTVTTIEDSAQILQNELNNPGSSDAVFNQITNPDYELNQKIDSSDSGYFQINDKVWNETSMQLLGKPVADLTNQENIALASHIQKNSPRSWNNWVAFNKQKHKDFDGITDEQIIENYGVPEDVISYINQSFDDPQTAKQVMLAESGGDSTAVNVNYTPQKEGEETVPQEILQQSESVLNEAQLLQSEFEIAEPATTATIDFETIENMLAMGDYPVSAQARDLTEFIFKGATGQYSGIYETKEFQSSKEVVELATNITSHIAEMPGIAIDIPVGLATEPVETLIGLVKFIPEEFNNLMIAANVVDVLNPFLGLVGKDFSREELNQMRVKAQKHIYDTGGVYTYFAASGLTHMGKKNSKIVEKNKEFSDIIDLSNDKPVSRNVTPEMQKAADVLKKNQKLKEQAELIKENELLTDYLEKWEIENKVEKAEAVAEQLELKLETKTTPKKTKKKVKTKKESKKPTPSKPLSELQARKKETQKLKAEAKQKKTQETKSTEIDLDRDMPSPEAPLSTKNNKIKKQAKKIEEKVIEVSKKVKQDKLKAEKTKLEKTPTEPVEQVKLTKSSDLNIGKGIEPIKGESARRFKTKEKLDAYIEQKLGDYVGENVIARYGELDKGGFVVKIFKKTKEQPLPKTATKRAGPKIEKEKTTEIVGKMRDPRGRRGETKRRIQNNDLLIEKYEAEISELGRNTSTMLDELVKLETQALETGVKSPRIELIKNSIDSTNRLINKAQRELRTITPTKEILKDVAKNISKRTAKGAVGRNVKQTAKERINQKIQNQKLVEDIKILFERGQTGLKMTKNNLINYLKELDADKTIIRHVDENFKELYDTATIQNAKELTNEIAKETPLSPGKVEGTRTATRTKDEYIDNMKIDIISGKEPNPTRLAMVDLIDRISTNFGAEKSAKAKGTRTLKDIERGTKEQQNIAKAFHELETGKLSIESLPETQAAHIHITYSLLEEFARTKDPAVRELLVKSLLVTKSYISEPARAMRNLRDLKAEGIRDWKQFEQFFNNDATLLELMKDIYEGKEIKRSRLFKLAEWARNAKLATGSSIVRSIAGNAFATVDAYGRMPIEFGFDYLIRKTSGALYELSNGYYGNLSRNQMSRLEIGAQVTGYTKGFRKTGNLLYDMFMENDAALRESAFFRREGFTHKDIKGFKGKVIRTPQRVQGMIDIMYRVPMTNAYMHRYAVRQAIREGRKTQTEILQRANEIMEKSELAPELLEQAIKDGEYVTFQRELGEVGKWVNKLRTGNTRMSAGAQILVPFFNTAGNLFKYTLEHSPANVFTANFRKGFVEAFSKEGAGSRRLATEMGKITTGLGTMYLLNEFLVENMKGNISGDWSNISAEERNMKTVDGQQEYSIEFQDGTTVSYRGFEPISSYLTMIEAIQRTEEDAYSSDENIEKYGNMVTNVTSELFKSFLENPFLAGTGDLFKVMNGRRDFLDFAFNQLAGMTVPGTYRQWLSVVDPVRRQRFKMADYDENTNYIDILESQAENILPWFIEGSNLPALDPFGNEIPKPDPVGGLLAWRQTERLNDPIYAEIQKIYFDQERGFKAASAFFTSSDLAKIKLSPAEHHALIKASGQELYGFINKAMQTDAWDEMTPALKRNVINGAKEKYIQVYRTLMFSKELAVPAAEMKAKELTGEFKTPKDRDAFLEKMRAGQLPKDYESLLDSLSTIYNP